MAKEENVFEKLKIFSASTSKVVTDVFLDAFPIRKVKFRNFNYNEKIFIDCYLDFADLALLAEDAKTGRLINKLDAGPLNVTMGGSKSSAIYAGKPESRVLSFGKSKDKIFVNMVSSEGKLGETGLIIPTSNVGKKISVAMDVDVFRKMLIYSNNCVNAYLATHISKAVRESEESRNKV